MARSASRQVLHSGHERQTRTATNRGPHRRVVDSQGEHRVGDRLEPGDVHCRSQGLFGVDPRGAQPGRQDATARPGQFAQARVGGDPVQPCADRPPLVVVAIVGAPGAQHRLLHQVLGFVDRSEHPVAVCEQLAPEGLGAALEIVPDILHLPPSWSHADTYRAAWQKSSVGAMNFARQPGRYLRQTNSQREHERQRQ